MCYRPHLKVFQHVLNHVAPRFPLGNLLFSSYRQGWTPKRRNSCRNHPILGKHEKSTTNRISKKIKKNLGGWTTQRKVHSPISAAAKNGECHETRWGRIECFSNDPIIKLTDIRLREICAIKRLAALRFFQLCLKLENPQKKIKKIHLYPFLDHVPNEHLHLGRACSKQLRLMTPLEATEKQQGHLQAGYPRIWHQRHNHLQLLMSIDSLSNEYI